MAGLLFLSELFHWPGQCGHEHCLFWLLASLQDWRRSLCWLIAHFCHVGKSGQLMQCAVERKLPVYLFASEDACLLPCDACFLPTGRLGGQAGIQAMSESSSLNRTWSSWSLFFLISKLGTLVRLTVFFVVVSLSFCRQTDETGQSWEQVSRVPASPHHIQWVSGVLTWEAGAGRAQACLPLMFLPLTHSAAFLTVWLSFSFPMGWLPPHSPHLPGGRWLPTAPSLQKATTYDTKAQATKEQNR